MYRFTTAFGWHFRNWPMDRLDFRLAREQASRRVAFNRCAVETVDRRILCVDCTLTSQPTYLRYLSNNIKQTTPHSPTNEKCQRTRGGVYRT